MKFLINHRVAGRILLTGLMSLASALAFSAATPSAPGFTPLYTADFESGAVGTTITNFLTVVKPTGAIYSKSVAGPFGGGQVLNVSNLATLKGFGGKINSVNLGAGKELWIRWYEYFPSGFVFGNNINGDANGGAGSIKWIRLQYPGTSERITLEIEATPSCATPCSNGLLQFTPHVVLAEMFDWETRYGNMGWWLTKPLQTFQTGQWHAVQMYVRLSPGSASTGDGNGLIRLWVDRTFLGETSRNTMPLNGGSLQTVHMGDYWNGGFPRDEGWYVDEMIMTSQTPGTVDAGGRPFIDPLTKVSDLTGSTTTPVTTYPPSAPSLMVK